MMAAARDQLDLRHYFKPLHPVVLRTARELARATEELGRELSVFGVSAVGRINLPLLLGAGLREFCLGPAELDVFAESVRAIAMDDARRRAEAAARASSQAELT